MKKKFKIATIIGARPQFIKAAPVSSAINSKNLFKEIIVHTGQHFDQNMSNIFFDEMKIPKPNYNLDINQMDYGHMIEKMVKKIIKVLQKDDINGILVYGDTNSTLAGSISAKKFDIPIFHIEAGLRSFNRMMPEENNRIITDHLSSLLFCPTNRAMKNLLNEGLNSGLLLSGDVMYDAYLKFSNHDDKNYKNQFGSNYILATVHRRSR